VGLAVKGLGQPDAGKRHVRLDEGALVPGYGEPYTGTKLETATAKGSLRTVSPALYSTEAPTLATWPS